MVIRDNNDYFRQNRTFRDLPARLAYPRAGCHSHEFTRVFGLSLGLQGWVIVMGLVTLAL